MKNYIYFFASNECRFLNAWLTRVGIEGVCCCCFGCQQIVCMTLHLSANYTYNLWVVAFENLSIPTPPVFLGFRNVATTAPLFNAVTVSMSWLCRLISCNIIVFVFLKMAQMEGLYVYIYICILPKFHYIIYIFISTSKVNTTAY